MPIAVRRLSISVSTRDTKKEATEWMVDRSMPGGLGLLESREVGVDDLAVAVEAEDQRDVDADACAVAAVIASRPSTVAGILIRAFGRSTFAQSALASAIVPVGVASEAGCDLDRDAAVDAAGAVVDGAEDVGGGANVVGRDVEDRGVDVGARDGELVEVLMVACRSSARRRRSSGWS